MNKKILRKAGMVKKSQHSQTIPSEELNNKVTNPEKNKNIRIYNTADKLFEDLGI